MKKNKRKYTGVFEALIDAGDDFSGEALTGDSAGTFAGTSTGASAGTSIGTSDERSTATPAEASVRAKMRLWFFSDRDTAKKQAVFVRYADSLVPDSGEITPELRSSYNKLALRLGLRLIGENERFATLARQTPAAQSRPVTRIPARSQNQRRSRNIPAAWKVAAVLVPVALALGGWFALESLGSLDTPPAMTIANSDQARTTLLPDSTHVSVNPGSSIDYREKKGVRMAELSGETFFKVRHDEAKPFVVSTDRMSVSVLGTEFNVREYPGEHLSTVSLFDGYVRVEIDGTTRSLISGQRLVHDHTTGEITVSGMAPVEMTDKGYEVPLRFEGASFREILDALSARHGVRITAAPGIDLDGGELVADFEDYTLDNALELLLRTQNDKWTYRKAADGSITIIDGSITITENE